MAISFTLDSPSNWIIFRLATLNRASRLVRRMHLGPRLVSYPRARKSERAPRTITEVPEADDLDRFIVFEVEQILFKVHMSLLRLKIWSPTDSQSTAANSSPPTVIAETAKDFRFFLWDLQAFPHELLQLHTGDSGVTHVVDRLLNITEMATKHKLPVLETHALESLHSFVLSPYFLAVSSAQHCRCLKLAASSSLRPNLLRDLSRRLIHIILRRRSTPPDDVLPTVEANPRLQKIQGGIYYRQLIDMEQYLDGRMAAEPLFPPTMDVERRMRFLAAHNSLSTLSSRICASTPLLPSRGCTSHTECLCAWDEMWAAAVARTKPTAADILGKLRSMTLILQRMVSEDPSMPIDCGLAALEAVVALRDDIIEGLSDHFVFP
ncbi:hypothetical protein C8R47DRAFT_1209985 [Mycena vitilis]|nr:hypothetical protein C8R47DRAFT_1209985 [Mycena vitilis]